MLKRMRTLYCQTNLLTELDLSQNPLLGVSGSLIYCYSNPLSVVYIWDGFSKGCLYLPNTTEVVTKK